MILSLLALILFACMALVAFYWKRLGVEEGLRQRASTLVVLLSLYALPAALMTPASFELPGWYWIFPLLALMAWGVLAVGFWSQTVVPVAALQPAPTLTGRRPLVPLFPSTEPAAATDERRHFRWTFAPHDGRTVEMEIDLGLSSVRYQAARAEERRPVGDWAHYAEVDMPELHALAAEFSRLHQNRNWSTLEQASNVLCFTQQCIDYQHDEDTTPELEWPRYPIETLMDQAGDCEDDVILTAAVLKRLGFDVALLYYPGHCALGVAGARGLPGEYVTHEGKSYFYGETTAEGWHLGEVPDYSKGQRPGTVELVQRLATQM